MMEGYEPGKKNPLPVTGKANRSQISVALGIFERFGFLYSYSVNDITKTNIVIVHTSKGWVFMCSENKDECQLNLKKK